MIARMRTLFSMVSSLRLLILVLISLSLTGCEITLNGLLNPKGIIAYQERQLFIDTLALMLIVVIPVIIMSFAFVYHYRHAHRADYHPDWSHSHFLEAIWWGVPCVIILILAVMTWKKSHELDPYRPIQADAPTLVIQAIALPYKWLFIYPQQGIATINELVMPVNQQVQFSITADNVAMSAFFVPQLGSQIYAMTGMKTKLYLFANETGDFEGMNSQFNGDGFSGMHFTAKVVTEPEMTAFIASAKASKLVLDTKAYDGLLFPSEGNKPMVYSGASPTLFDDVVMLYMKTFGTVHPRQNLQMMKKD